MFFKRSEFRPLTGTCLSQDGLWDRGRRVEGVGGRREDELVFKWSPPGRLPARVSGPWVRARFRGDDIKRVEVPGSTDRERERGSFRKLRFDQRGIYSQNWENKLCVYSVHLWPDIREDSACYQRSHHGTTDESMDVFTCSIIGSNLEPCLEKVRNIFFYIPSCLA